MCSATCQHKLRTNTHVASYWCALCSSQLRAPLSFPTSCVLISVQLLHVCPDSTLRAQLGGLQVKNKATLSTSSSRLSFSSRKSEHVRTLAVLFSVRHVACTDTRTLKHQWRHMFQPARLVARLAESTDLCPSHCNDSVGGNSAACWTTQESLASQK